MLHFLTRMTVLVALDRAILVCTFRIADFDPCRIEDTLCIRGILYYFRIHVGVLVFE